MRKKGKLHSLRQHRGSSFITITISRLSPTNSEGQRAKQWSLLYIYIDTDVCQYWYSAGLHPNAG